MPARTIERWKGLEIHLEGRRIVYARFKYGSNPQLWEEVPGSYYASKTDLLDYKTAFTARRKRGSVSKTVQFTGTFEDYWPSVLAKDVSIKASTKRRYKSVLESHWIDPIRKRPLHKIGRDQILGLVNHMLETPDQTGKPLGPATIACYLTPVQRIFTYAIKEDGCYREVNPVGQVSLKRRVKTQAAPKIPVYSTEEIETLVMELSEKYRAFVLLAYGIGARRGELLGLRWEHIERKGPNDSFVFIEGQLDPITGEWVGLKTEQEEGGIGRYVSLPPELFPVLDWQKLYCGRLDVPEGVTVAVQPTSYVFPDILPGTLTEYVRRLRERLGGRFNGEDGWAPFTVHKLRHNFGSQMIRAGASPAYVAEQMGDTVETVLRRYTHEWGKGFADQTRTGAAIMGRALSVLH